VYHSFCFGCVIEVWILIALQPNFSFASFGSRLSDFAFYLICALADNALLFLNFTLP
jgi:hypothetical protein